MSEMTKNDGHMRTVSISLQRNNLEFEFASRALAGTRGGASLPGGRHFAAHLLGRPSTFGGPKKLAPIKCWSFAASEQASERNNGAAHLAGWLTVGGGGGFNHMTAAAAAASQLDSLTFGSRVPHCDWPLAGPARRRCGRPRAAINYAKHARLLSQLSAGESSRRADGPTLATPSEPENGRAGANSPGGATRTRIIGQVGARLPVGLEQHFARLQITSRAPLRGAR